jgi:heparin/heparan-sulfate lyase
LRGQPEFFVVFDRVEATRPEFRRHFFLHVPTEPQVDANRVNWLSLPAADGDKTVLSQGRTRMYLTTVLPQNARIVTRGGPGKEAWGHPLELKAQYNHLSEGRLKPPICPWRIEVADQNPGARTLFLHVFEIADPTNRAPSGVKFVAPAGVDIGERWQVRFNAAGPLAGKIDNRNLATAVDIEVQNRAAR